MEKVKKRKKQYSTKSIISMILKYISLIFMSVIIILPLFVVFFGSFKTKEEFVTQNPLTLPKTFLNFDNYVTAFVDGNMMAGFRNTVFILFFSILATVLTGTMTAYIINRFRFKGRGLINALFLAASLIPSITMQMSVFVIIHNLGLFNTVWSVIVLFAGTDIISIYIFVQFLENISTSLDESAIVDGASYFTIFFKILLPLLKPAIVTVIIIKGVGFYNEFYTPHLYMQKKELQVLSTSLYSFTGPYGSEWQVISAGIIITIIPTLIVFLALQKQIYSGMTAGSVKG